MSVADRVIKLAIVLRGLAIAAITITTVPSGAKASLRDAEGNLVGTAKFT